MSKSITVPVRSREKARAYYEASLEIYNRIAGDPSYTLREEKNTLNDMATQNVLFATQNDVLTQPLNLRRDRRISSLVINDFIANSVMDCIALFNQLQSVVNMVNELEQLIDIQTSVYMSKIDELLDRIENLSKLKSLRFTYDNVYNDTFVNDTNNISDNDFRSLYHEAGGLYTLQDINTDNIVRNKDNANIRIVPLHAGVYTDMYGDTISGRSLLSNMDVSVYSSNLLNISDYEVGSYSNDEPVSLNYDGMVTGVIINLPTNRIINSLSMKYASNGNTNLLSILTTKEYATNIESFSWEALDYTIDKNTLSGKTITFESKEVVSVLLILGQTKSIKRTVNKKHLLELQNKMSLASIIEQLQESSNKVKDNHIDRYLPPDMVNTLSEEVRSILSNLSNQIEIMLEEEPIEEDAIDVYEYNLGLYSLDISYHKFNNSSKYVSNYYGGLGDISDIVITTNEDKPENTSINHYIELENGEHRIVPTDITEIKDIITVEDVDIISYDTDFILDTTKDVNVYLNNNLINSITDYDFNIIDSSISKSHGITMNASVNTGDLIVIEYTPADYDYRGKTQRVHELSIDESLNMVSLKEQLTNGNNNRAIVTNTSGIAYSYDLFSEIYPTKYPDPDFEDDTRNGYIITDFKSMTPTPEIVGNVSSGYVIDYTTVQLSSNNLYYGIINEEINSPSNMSSPYEYETMYDYIPGSLHVEYKGNIISIDEYETDTPSTIYDKNIFTSIVEATIDTPFIVSYTPIVDNEYTESNLSDPNTSEIFMGTDSDSTITLEYKPYVDKYILNQASDEGGGWIFSNGQFINRVNEQIVFSPIEVIIDGKVVENATNYLTGEEPNDRQFLFTGINYQYYVSENKIIFNTNINRPINVAYYHVNDSFRLVSKMYRTNRQVDDITPSLYGYSLYTNLRGTD